MNIIILGGRGYVGRAICAALQKHTVYTFDRHPGKKLHIQGSILSVSDLKEAFRGKDVVINLVGLTPTKHMPYETYYATHVTGVRNVIVACKEMKIKRLLHMSALGANTSSLIAYVKTKGLGEKEVLASGLKITVFCPSIIFDKENELVYQAKKIGWTRCFPKIPATVQPVYRKDIAHLYALAVAGKIKEKKIEVGGPETMTIFSFMQQIFQKLGYTCIGFPLSLVKFGMHLLRLMPFSIIGMDQIRFLTKNNTTRSHIAEKYVTLTSFSSWLKKVRL